MSTNFWDFLSCCCKQKFKRVEDAATNPPLAFSNARDLGGSYKDTGKSLISLICAMGDYYKHNDAWGSEEWNDDELDPKIYNSKARSNIERARKTRRRVNSIGVARDRSDNMLTAYKFLGVDRASERTRLAHKVQEWAKVVYENCADP